MLPSDSFRRGISRDGKSNLYDLSDADFEKFREKITNKANMNSAYNNGNSSSIGQENRGESLKENTKYS